MGPSRRRCLWGSSAVAPAAQMSRGRPATVPRAAPRAVRTKIAGATVSPAAYGITGWVQAAKTFDSYVGLPLATTIQKIYMTEGQYFTNPLPVRIRALAHVGCQFIICVFPSRTIDESKKLANFLQ